MMGHRKNTTVKGAKVLHAIQQPTNEERAKHLAASASAFGVQRQVFGVIV
jgi:hypothetical protein